MPEFTKEKSEIETLEEQRLDDRRWEMDFWQNAFWAAGPEGGSMTKRNVPEFAEVADLALEEFRKRFQ